MMKKSKLKDELDFYNILTKPDKNSSFIPMTN